MYTKEQIYQLMVGNENRISDSLYPNEEIEDILNEISWDREEYLIYREYAGEWAHESPLLIGYISK